MSVSILLLPVAIALSPVVLAARLVMGKEGFENFLNSMEYRVRTDFSSKKELGRVLRQSGHDLVHFSGLLKTHLNGESNYFFWEFVDGQWEAVFSTFDDPAMLHRFMDSVEQAAGRAVFSRNVEQTATPMRFTTTFTDAELLQKTLRDFGAPPTQTSTGEILCRID